MAMAHLGVGVMVIGIVSVTAWREEVNIDMAPGEQLQIAGTTITYLGESPLTGPNYSSTVGRFKVERGGAQLAELTSEKRIFLPSRQPTTEVGIYPMWTGDLYVVMGDQAPDGKRTVRAYFNPLVNFIWFGGLIFIIGAHLCVLPDARERKRLETALALEERAVA